MMDAFRFQITEEMEEERIDKCMSMLIDSLSRSYIQKLIKEESVIPLFHLTVFFLFEI